MTNPARPAEDAGFREALQRLARETASTSQDRLHVATCLLPPDCDPLELWNTTSSDEFAAFWEADGETIAGVGATVRAAIPDARFGTHVPRWFGSVPFVNGWADRDWSPLIDLGFVLPRWTLHRAAAGENVKLSLVVRGPMASRDLEAVEAEFATIMSAVAGGANENRPPGGIGRGPGPGGGSPDDIFARAVWQETVRSALSEIDEGRLEKVVLARRIAVPLPPGLRAVDIIEGLRRENAGRFRFGLRHRRRAFVGASPECLFQKRGRSVRVEALAGTYDLEANDGADLVQAAEHLFDSGKDMAEHALVVRGVIETLEPLAQSVVPDDWPQVREARRLAHLSTTVRAHLRGGVTALDLIGALHPTPAVGGLPVAAALRFIRRNEPAPRGLFAAPIGWMDAEGDACLAVGIRSALLLESHAWVYAGAGIVASSDPAAEWDETTAKLRWLRELIASRAESRGAAGPGSEASVGGVSGGSTGRGA
ncbi:MAG: isochorismate synthase [Gemmatimonadota bacterium]